MAGLQHLMFCSSPLTQAWCCVQRHLLCMKDVLICAGFTNKFLEERMQQQSKCKVTGAMQQGWIREGVVLPPAYLYECQTKQ